ncbi:TOMM precursor leader peptide-binding protein [Curtobacterium sp. RRHDQ10]|uniref:TOMM precursor leader peptide-binding protein n=1 Tax=Curtobacterium phyllosphaerae TaxID=3413379 RepID=UPI003BF2AA76
MGLRIDPALEFVWRDVRTVQLGVDPQRAVVDVATTPAERFLSAVRRETARDALPVLAEQFGCPPATAAAVLGTAAPALVDVVPEPDHLVEVHGTGAVADRVVAQLLGEQVRVVRTSAPPGGPVPIPDPPPDLAVVVADLLLDPVLRSTWVRRRVPQVPAVIGDGTVRLGPVLEPDAGACLACLELWRVDEDPAWPAIAGQVWGRRLPEPTPWRTDGIAAAVTGLVLDRLRPGRASRASAPDGRTSWIDRSDLTVRTRTVGAHPRCACRVLPRNDSAAVPRPGRSPAPTTSP